MPYLNAVPKCRAWNLPFLGSPKEKAQPCGLGFFLDLNGAGERNRTLDLLITNELLYRLSYTGV